MGEELGNKEKEGFNAAARGFYSGSKGSPAIKGGGKATSFFKKTGPIIAAFLVIFMSMMSLVSFLPSILIGTIKENLLGALGFKNTAAVLEKQAEYVVEGTLASGEMPAGLYEDFLAQGIEVGQVTLAGDFVQTRVYIADLDSEVAADGDYESHGAGELAIRFKGEVIPAADFVAKVESNPVLYAAYAEAVDISARFYYSSAVNEVYDNMGLDRNAFKEWEATGDEEKDQVSFNVAVKELLDTNIDVNTASQYDDWQREEKCDDSDPKKPCECDVKSVNRNWDATTDGNGSFAQAQNLVIQTANNSRKSYSRDGKNKEVSADQNGAQLLNATLSSGEPYSATNAFLTVVEAIEQAQAGDNGPVNYVMNMLSVPNQVTYYDFSTDSMITSNESVLESTNFLATVSDAKYSREEAYNFSRDRVLAVTKLADDDAINSTVVSSDGGQMSGLGIAMKNGQDEKCKQCRKDYFCNGSVSNDCSKTCGAADEKALLTATSSIELGLMEKNSNLFSTTVGANRIVEGGSFLSNSINQYVLGAMPSDEFTVISYQKEVDEVLARQKAAERATKSPFDVSSPNTFMGSLVRKVAMASLPSYGKSGSLIASFGQSLFSLARNAISGLTGSAMADGDEEKFTTMMGECTTVGITGASCDLYGTAHGTVNTDYIEMEGYNTIEGWKQDSDFAGLLDKDGQIIDGKNGLTEFIMYGMGRTTTVGVRNYEVCKSYKEKSYNFLQKFWDSIMNGAGGLESQCNNVDDKIANGTAYTFSGLNGNRAKVEKYSAFVLFDTVSSLLEGKTSRVAVYREKYLNNGASEDKIASRSSDTE